MKTYTLPENALDLLNRVIETASKTPFYSSKGIMAAPLGSLGQVSEIPSTPLSEYRVQRLSDLLAAPDEVQWIAGPFAARDGTHVSVAEGADESALRFDLLTDAVKDAFPNCVSSVAIVLASPEQRYFAAEVAGALIHSRIQAHVLTFRKGARLGEMMRTIQPGLVVLAGCQVDETALPGSVELCVTVRSQRRPSNVRQLDFLYLDEIGFMGQSENCRDYRLNADSYYFERDERGVLVVTSLHNRVQPVLRLATNIKVELATNDTLRLEKPDAPNS